MNSRLFFAIFRCKTAKKKVVVKRKKKIVLSSQRQGNVTSVPIEGKAPLDKKAALKSKVQDILSGRLRFVIRKVPTRGKESSSDDQGTSKVQEKENVLSRPSVSQSNYKEKKERYSLFNCLAKLCA